MANIFVDPVIVVTPTDETGREGIVVWLENLSIWLDEALSAHFLWLHANNITEQLEAHGRLPNFEILKTWVNRYRLDINPKLLARNINTFFRDPEHDLENKLAEMGYMEAGNSVIIEPEQLVTRWPEFIYTAMCNLLVTCSVCKYATHPFACDLQIVTWELSTQSQEMRISSVIKESLYESACKPGDVIAQTFPLLFTPDDLPSINVLELWYKGESGIMYAIEQQFKKNWQKVSNISLKFSLGSHFIESIANVGLDTNESVLRKIIWLAAAVIADQAKQIESAKLHPLRKTFAGDSPQRIRSMDQAKAWRLDIAKHGAGWRLHYWHISDSDGGAIEFSNICKESDSHIYE